MSRRILFAIRSKLGDTLISYACVRAYADAHPNEEVTLLTRNAYAKLFRYEAGIRLLTFDSRLEMLAKLMWLRLTTPSFDVLAVLWGSGAPIRRIGQWVRAKRKIAWSRRFAPEIFEEASLPADHWLIDPAACVIRTFDPTFIAPRELRIPSLVARYRETAKEAVGIVPIADELRRNFDPTTLDNLLAEVRRRHPGAPIRIFVNKSNRGAERLVHQRFPAGVELRTFAKLDALLSEYMELSAWYGTDTGLYHLAVSLGIPATVFFGPTQPHKIVMSGQPNVRWIRLGVLGDSHCDETACANPLCLHQAVATFCGGTPALTLSDTPAACTLRAWEQSRIPLIRSVQPLASNG